MNRSPMPPRSAPLASTTPLPPGKPPSRGVSLRRQSARPREAAGQPRRRTRRDTGPTAKVRRLVLERDGYACVCCGVSVIGQPYSLQHRKRRSQGGGNSPSNLIVVLGTGTTGCHERIDSRRDPHDEAQGYTVRSWQDPALIPVMMFSTPGGGGVTYWLTGDGQRTTEAPEGVAA